MAFNSFPIPTTLLNAAAIANAEANALAAAASQAAAAASATLADESADWVVGVLGDLNADQVADTASKKIMTADERDKLAIYIGRKYRVRAEEFGAIVLNDQSAAAANLTTLHAARDWLVTNIGGGIVDLPRGIIYINNTLRTRTGAGYNGAGPTQTFVRLADSSNCDVIGTLNFEASSFERENSATKTPDRNFSITNLTVDGVRANQAVNGKGNGLSLYGYAYVVDNVYAVNCRGAGYYSEYAGTDPVVFAQWANNYSPIVDNVCVTACDAGIIHRGPNDCQWGRITSQLCGNNDAYAATLTNGSADITVTDGTKFTVDQPVRFDATVNGFTSGQAYYVKTIVGNVITLAKTQGGTALLSSGATAMSVTPMSWEGATGYIGKGRGISIETGTVPTHGQTYTGGGQFGQFHSFGHDGLGFYSNSWLKCLLLESEGNAAGNVKIEHAGTTEMSHIAQLISYKPNRRNGAGVKAVEIIGNRVSIGLLALRLDAPDLGDSAYQALVGCSVSGIRTNMRVNISGLSVAGRTTVGLDLLDGANSAHITGNIFAIPAVDGTNQQVNGSHGFRFGNVADCNINLTIQDCAVLARAGHASAARNIITLNGYVNFSTTGQLLLVGNWPMPSTQDSDNFDSNKLTISLFDGTNLKTNKRRFSRDITIHDGSAAITTEIVTTIPHNCPWTPRVDDFTVFENYGSRFQDDDIRYISIRNITSTTFDLAVKVDAASNQASNNFVKMVIDMAASA